jgi:diacylglycerol O-acyltransferase
VWVDDPSFNLEYHIRHTALPTPGGWEQLCGLTARIFSQQLDRSKPLWEMWLIEGLQDDRFALITKTHHSLIDGIAGVDLATVLFDLSPDPPVVRHAGRPWQPHSEPGAAELVAAGIRGAVRAGLELAEGAIDAFAHPERALSRAREAAEGVGEIVWAGLNPAPETPLNVPIGPHRRFYGIASSLDDFKTVKNAFGGTVNDVVLAVSTGALRRLLDERGEELERPLRAMVPVNLRGEDHDHLGNQVTSLFVELPIGEADILDRYERTRAAATQLKSGTAALGGSTIVLVAGAAPPLLHESIAKALFAARLFNITITNVPGPQIPLYGLGTRLRRILPLVPLFAEHAVGMAIVSYDGELVFGINADRAATPDLDVLTAALRDEFAALLSLARA